MGRQLYDLDVPPEVRENEHRLRDQGIRVQFFEPRYLLPTLAFFKETFPGWAYNFYRKLEIKPWPLDELVIVVHGNRVIGYCQQYGADHVGPFGIRPEYQGKGVGTVMVYHLLLRMQQRDFRFAWFGMTERAERFYARIGFEKTRTILQLKKSLLG
jgi:mycothiol synthase